MKKLKFYNRTLFIYGGTILGAILLGLILMVVVYTLPTAKMKENVRKSLEMLEKEGDYPVWGENAITQLDQFTDAAMIKMAIMEPDMSLIERAMLNPYLIYKKDSTLGQTDLIRAAINEDYEQGRIAKNLRYWNGFLIILKPLMLFL